MSSSGSDGISGFIGLVENAPPGVNIFKYLRGIIDNDVNPQLRGPHRVLEYIFLSLHLLVTFLSLLGVIARLSRRNIWFFRVLPPGYILPNTSILTQLCFALYSIFFTIAVFVDYLNPSSSLWGYWVDVSYYVWLGWAMHFQMWMTVVARPKEMVRPLNINRVGGDFGKLGVKKKLVGTNAVGRNGERLVLGKISISPLVLNTAMISVLVIFSASIFIGRGLGAGPNNRLQKDLEKIDSSLDQESASNNTDVTVLIALLPIFENLEHNGNELRRRLMNTVWVWLSWAILWIVTYAPAALSLIRTLRSQETHIQSSLRHLKELDQISSKVVTVDNLPREIPIARNSIFESPNPLPNISESDQSMVGFTKEKFDLPLPPTSAASSFDHNRSPSKSSIFPSRLLRPGSTSSLRETPSYRIGVPKPRVDNSLMSETMKKLDKVRKVRVVVWCQFLATMVMLIGHLGLVIYVEIPSSTNNPQREIEVTLAWRGFAFIIPALLTSFIFAYTGLFQSHSHNKPVIQTLVLQEGEGEIV